MGIVPCPLACHTENESQSDPNHHHLCSESTSLSPQSSLPSLPSLSPQQPHHNHHQTTYHCISTLQGHSSQVFSLSLAGKFLYSGSSDSEIRVWQRHPPCISKPNSPSTISSHDNQNIVAFVNGAVKSLVVSGDKLFSAHQDHKIRVWSINNDSNSKRSMYKHLATLPTLADRLLRFLPPKNHIQIRRHKKCTWVHHVDTISALALSPDASVLYSVSWDRTIKIWQTHDFKCLESINNAHDDAINALALSNDGYVYTGSADTKIKVWRKNPDNKKHSLVATLEKHKSAVNALALSTDGSVLFSGACDRSIVVWKRAAAGEEGGHMVAVGGLRGHSKAILCLSMLSDLLFSGSADKTVRIWKRGSENSYSCLAVLEGHKGPVKCLTAAIDRYDSVNKISADSISYLVYSGSLDCDIRVWQIMVPLQ